MRDEGEHAVAVDAWLERAAGNQPPKVVLEAFEAAFTALWSCTNVTLGEVTLGAIADRVLHTAAERHPELGRLKLGPAGRLDTGALAGKLAAARNPALWEGCRFVLIELLTVLGHLTAEILTPELHAELSRLAPPTPDGADPGARRASSEAPVAAGKERHS